MKKLVLGSLLLAALASQTTGCIITSDDPDDEATIDAEWSFHSVNPAGQLSPENPCPAGYPTVALHTQELDSNDRPVGSPVIDLFDCDRFEDFSDPLFPGVYDVFLRVTSDSGLDVYAETIPEIIDVTVSDKLYTGVIVDNGGFFKMAWALKDQANNAPLQCRDVAALDEIEIAATVSGSTAMVSTAFDCERGFDYSDPVQEGTYVLSIDALNSAGQAIGPGRVLNNEVMEDRNFINDLGTVELLVPRN